MNIRKIIVSGILIMGLLLGGCSENSENVETTNEEVISYNETTNVDATTDIETTVAEDETTIQDEVTEDEVTTVEEESATEENTTEKDTTEKQTTDTVTTERTTTEKQTTDKITEKNTTTVQNTTTADKSTEETTTTSSGEILSEEEAAYRKDMLEKREIAISKIKKIMPTIVNSSMTELQKVIAIHDWIITNVDYALDDYQNGTISKYAHTAWGALETGYIVCNGYAELFRLMAAEVGIEAKDISGYGNIGLGDQDHRWSQVKIDGKWYNLDLTWDDPVWKDKEFDDNVKTNYNYFLLSDEEFYKDHKVYDKAEYNPVPPSECKVSMGITNIVDASVVKRAVYFYDEKDYDKLREDVADIVKTNIDSFAIYCMNGDYEKHLRTINSIVAKTLGKYVHDETSSGLKDYSVLYYSKDDEMLVASGEAECMELIKQAVEAHKKGITLKIRCVDEAFADDKENYDGDRYYNSENKRRIAVLYKWAARAGLHYIFVATSGDGYADDIYIQYEHDYGKVIVSDSEENSTKLIKEYLDSLTDVSEAKIYLIFNAEGVEENKVGNYLAYYGYMSEYNINTNTPYVIAESVYYMSDINVGTMKYIYDFDSLKTYIEEKKVANQKGLYAFYYDDNITEENYYEYTWSLYKNIGDGMAIYNTQFIRDGLVYIMY